MSLSLILLMAQIFTFSNSKTKKLKEKHVPYPYQKVVPWILGAFIIAVAAPQLVADLRYGSFRWLWQIGSFGSFMLMILVNLVVIGNALFTLTEFSESGKYNWFWFVLGLIPVLFYGKILIGALSS